MKDDIDNNLQGLFVVQEDEATPAAGPSPAREADDDEPLYVDDRGIPMLFDVVMPGEHCKTAGIALLRKSELGQAPTADAPASKSDLNARIDAAIDAALPAASAQAAALLRESLFPGLEAPATDTSTATHRDAASRDARPSS
ncbi:hypothetical protein CAI21_05110 [Alkalilimnicola ehrlichii]|uniref:Uncharacterized protein n=1 Tax=Alkalilimnicola ehrlichii TaxID=351052 RepID=A0A3E0WYE6_9GAMM|nr:hypothetical protein [Alkalilimnicola ehrlichii]RFA30450.1 hypothetical protein CAI21_05110 [Alkalilimnicola ehrlichii]RFA38002.1 hypothetical protein CAL65_06480 [Alkalilimnicola ehrlichii]